MLNNLKANLNRSINDVDRLVTSLALQKTGPEANVTMAWLERTFKEQDKCEVPNYNKVSDNKIICPLCEKQREEKASMLPKKTQTLPIRLLSRNEPPPVMKNKKINVNMDKYNKQSTEVPAKENGSTCEKSCQYDLEIIEGKDKATQCNFLSDACAKETVAAGSNTRVHQRIPLAPLTNNEVNAAIESKKSVMKKVSLI